METERKDNQSGIEKTKLQRKQNDKRRTIDEKKEKQKLPNRIICSGLMNKRVMILKFNS